MRAEGSPFATALGRGEVPAPAYATYLAALRRVYEALEVAVAEHREHPVVAAVADPRLHRLAALDDDLAVWSPSGPPDVPPCVSRAASAYAEVVRDLAATAPDRLLAHHYVRYLGDLSGGQVVAAGLRRRHGLAEDAPGLDLYRFPAIEALVPYKRGYRDQLDALHLDERATAAQVDEARRAFALTERLLAVLGSA